MINDYCRIWLKDLSGRYNFVIDYDLGACHFNKLF